MEERAGLLRRARTEAEGDVELRERERTSIESETERLVADLSRLTGDGRAVDERRGQLAGRVVSWKESARDEHGRAGALSAALAERESELETLGRDLARLQEHARVANQGAQDKSSAMR